MEIIRGKYANANIYATVIENSAKDSIKKMLDQPFVEASKFVLKSKIKSRKRKIKK